MPLIPYPSVPNVPGVPVLLRSVTVPTPGALFNVALGGLAQSVFGGSTWGVLDAAGEPIVTPDSFVGVDYTNNCDISNYPMEAGAFSSYNKVANPYDCAVTMSIGADLAARTAFLAKLEKTLNSLDMLSVVTPEATYINANLRSFDYRRTASSGMSLITVTCRFVQIRQTAKSSVRNTADPSGMDAASGGQVQTSEPTDDQITLSEGIA